jgi:ketosteroid isomerase-like protein
MTDAIDVVRDAFAAPERGDTTTAFGAFAPRLTSRLHGVHPLAGTF